jgi:hypothetical protein
MRFSALITIALTLFVSALGMPSQAQDANSARTKCTEFGFKENTKDHDECVKQVLQASGSKATAKPIPPKKPSNTQPPPVVAERQIEEEYWKDAKKIDNKDAYQAYLRKYPVGLYADLAKAKIVQINSLQSVKVEADQQRNENQKNLPCSTTLTYNYWTNCFGTYSWPDGGKYVGMFKDGKFDGQGTSTSSNGNKYVGEFSDNKLNGQGTFYWSDGDKYVGEYKDNKRNGQGTYYYQADNQLKGDKYVGEHRNGMFNGVGTYTWSSGNKYIGEFRNDKRTGQGTFYFLADDQWKGDKYVGEFLDGIRNGQGTYYWLNGDKFMGEIRGGAPNGKGTYTYSSGNKYIGEFRDGLFNGQGAEFGPTGNVIYSGKYLNGKSAP